MRASLPTLLTTCLLPIGLCGQLTVASDATLFVGDAASPETTLYVDADLRVDVGGSLEITGLAEVTGDAQFAGTMEFPVSGEEAGIGHGQINVGGQATLDGELQASTLPTYTPSGIVILPLINAGGVTGKFLGSSTLPSDDWQVEYTDTQVNLTFGTETVGTQARPAAAAFTIHPNPTVHTLNLTGQLPKSSRYRIVDVAGRLMLSGTLPAGPKQARIELPGDLPNGLYVLQFEGQTGKRFEVIR
ncbi:MAG: T9SS type A sorting domain-containing protein [Lewinella sp.]